VRVEKAKEQRGGKHGKGQTEGKRGRQSAGFLERGGGSTIERIAMGGRRKGRGCGRRLNTNGRG